MPKMVTFGKEILGLATFEGFKWLLFLLFSMFFAKLVGSVTGHIDWIAPYKWDISVTVFTGVLVLIIITYRRFGKTRPLFPSLDCDFRIPKKIVSYEYRAPSEIIYKRSYTLVALKDNLDRYVDKFHWTGNGKVGISVADSEQQIQLTDRKNVFQFFEIRFSRPHGRKEIIKSEVIWQLDDLNRVAVPFISATIDEPTDNLLFKLTFPKSMGIKEIVCAHSPDIASKKVFRSHTKLLDECGSASWEILNPKLKHYYEVNWKPHEQDHL